MERADYVCLKDHKFKLEDNSILEIKKDTKWDMLYNIMDIVAITNKEYFIEIDNIHLNKYFKKIV